MKTVKLQSFNLRGMDHRWISEPQDALFIADMFWTQNDSWRSSGGYQNIYSPKKLEFFPTNDQIESYSVTELEIPTRYAQIDSIHWFAQHNGARQWLIFEECNYDFDVETNDFIKNGTTTLKVFDGSLAGQGAEATESWVPFTRYPERTLFQYAATHTVNRFTPANNTLVFQTERQRNPSGIRTQSQTYGGRIYLVNGFDEAIVFDGSYCERAGFTATPTPPSATAGEYNGSTTFPIAIGDDDDPWFGIYSMDKPQSRGFYGQHRNIPYFGVGVTSDATIGAGAYKWIYETKLALDDEDANDSKLTEFPQSGEEGFQTNIEAKVNYYSGEQGNPRKCGYQYKVTFVNERGQESEASASSSIVTVKNGSGGDTKSLHGKCLIAVDIPIGPNACVARRVYRTRNVYDSSGSLYAKGDQRSFYFLTEIDDNVSTQFLDGHPDTSLGELLDLVPHGNFPTNTKFLALFKNTMFAAGQELNEIQYSEPLFPEVFPKLNKLTIGDDDGGPITGIKATKNALVVFKTRGIYLVKGDPVNGFRAETLNKDVGCAAPDSIAELPGLGLVFLSEDSVYLLEGALENTGTITGVVNIGLEISLQTKQITKSASIRACSAVYQKDKEYWLAVPMNGISKNIRCLIYHYECGSWSVRDNFQAGCMVTSKDHRGYLFIGSNANENDTSLGHNNGILTYTRGSSIKGSRTGLQDGFGREFLSTYTTVSTDYQSVFSTFRPAYLMPYCVQYGDSSLFVNYNVNRSQFPALEEFQPAVQQDPNERYPVMNKAEWDIDTWVGYRPTVLRYDISATHVGPVREMSLTFTSEHKFELIGYDLEAKVGEQNNIRPLNTKLRPSRR